MISNFTATVNGTEFELKTMNTIRLQLFQVYAIHEGKKIRFHMQRNTAGDFLITDHDHCPGPYRILERELSQTILDYGKSVNAE